MPSAMIHLLSAKKLDISSDPLFNVGSVAPDAVQTREQKDIFHLRTFDRGEREKRLHWMSHRIPGSDIFGEAALFHLFLDSRWDPLCFVSYRDAHQGEENWFRNYRREISLASAYIYHSTDWGKGAWDGMLSVPRGRYGRAGGASRGALSEYLTVNGRWHDENDIGPSEVYSPDFVERFTDDAVAEYKEWRKM